MVPTNNLESVLFDPEMIGGPLVDPSWLLIIGPKQDGGPSAAVWKDVVGIEIKDRAKG